MSNAYYRGSSIRFDPAEFFVPPSLEKGTSERLQVWIQSAHSRALDIIAHSGHFPWSKNTDVARWAVQHGLRYVETIDKDIGGLSSLMRQANIITATNDQITRNLTFIANMDKTQQNVLILKGSGDIDEAKDLVMTVWKEICAMPDEPDREARWKKKYMDKFESLFRDMIEYKS